MGLRALSEAIEAEMEEELRTEMEEYEDAVVLYDRIAKRNKQSVRGGKEGIGRSRKGHSTCRGRS